MHFSGFIPAITACGYKLVLRGGLYIYYFFFFYLRDRGCGIVSRASFGGSFLPFDARGAPHYRLAPHSLADDCLDALLHQPHQKFRLYIPKRVYITRYFSSWLMLYTRTISSRTQTHTNTHTRARARAKIYISVKCVRPQYTLVV